MDRTFDALIDPEMTGGRSLAAAKGILAAQHTRRRVRLRTMPARRHRGARVGLGRIARKGGNAVMRRLKRASNVGVGQPGFKWLDRLSTTQPRVVIAVICFVLGAGCAALAWYWLNPRIQAYDVRADMPMDWPSRIALGILAVVGMVAVFGFGYRSIKRNALEAEHSRVPKQPLTPHQMLRRSRRRKDR